MASRWICQKCSNTNPYNEATCVKCSAPLPVLSANHLSQYLNSTAASLQVLNDRYLQNTSNTYFNQSTYDTVFKRTHYLSLPPWYIREVHHDGLVTYTVNTGQKAYSPQEHSQHPLFLREQFLIEKNADIIKNNLTNPDVQQAVIVEQDQFKYVIPQDINVQFGQFENNTGADHTCCRIILDTWFKQPFLIITAALVWLLLLLLGLNHFKYLTKFIVFVPSIYLIVTAYSLYFITLIPTLHYILIITCCWKDAKYRSHSENKVQQINSTNEPESYYNPYAPIKFFKIFNLQPYDSLLEYIFRSKRFNKDLKTQTEIQQMMAAEPLLYSYIENQSPLKANINNTKARTVLEGHSRQQIPIVASKDISPPLPLLLAWLPTLDCSIIQIKFVYNFECPVLQQNELIAYQLNHKRQYIEYLSQLTKKRDNNRSGSFNDPLISFDSPSESNIMHDVYINTQLHYLLPSDNGMLLSATWINDNNSKRAKNKAKCGYYLSSIVLNRFVALLLMLTTFYWPILFVYSLFVTQIKLSTTKYIHLGPPTYDSVENSAIAIDTDAV